MITWFKQITGEDIIMQSENKGKHSEFNWQSKAFPETSEGHCNCQDCATCPEFNKHKYCANPLHQISSIFRVPNHWQVVLEEAPPQALPFSDPGKQVARAGKIAPFVISSQSQ